MNKINHIIILLSIIFGIVIWLAYKSLDYTIIGSVGFMVTLGLIVFFFEKYLQTAGDKKND